MSGIIDRIDDVIEDWVTSPDAMHWTANPPASPILFSAGPPAPPRIDETFRLAACAWLTANGINPNDVPTDAMCIITRRHIHCQVWQRDKHGKLRIVGDDVPRSRVIVPLQAAPPELVLTWAVWLRPGPGRRRTLARRRRW